MEPPSLDHLPDEELLARYLGETDQSGVAFLGIWNRYRHMVRTELEAAGLSAEEAERSIGGVFDGLQRSALGADLRTRLQQLARCVALRAGEGEP